MKTFVEIEWDEPQEQHWLCAENIQIALSAYCTKTQFKVTKADSNLTASKNEQARLRHQLLDLQYKIDGCRQALEIARNFLINTGDIDKAIEIVQKELSENVPDWRKEPMHMAALTPKQNPFLAALKDKK